MINHEEVDNIELSIVATNAAIHSNQEGYALIELEKAIFLSQNIAEKEALKIKNLF